MEDRTWLVALEVARNFDTVGPPLPPAPGTPYHPPHVHTLPDVPVQSTRLAALPWRRSGLPEPQTPETPTSFGGFAGGVEEGPGPQPPTPTAVERDGLQSRESSFSFQRLEATCVNGKDTRLDRD